jgi:carboxypeptidase family protein
MAKVHMRSWTCDVCFAALVCLFAIEPLAAQPKVATLSGTVTDRTTGRALERVEITLLSDHRSVTTDSTGRYVFAGLPTGVSQLVVRVVPFPAHNIIVELQPGQDLVRPIVLDSAAARSAQTLPAVSVTADQIVSYRLVDFERRRRVGRGQYLTEDELVRSGAYTLQDAVIRMRGVIVDCGGPTCRIHMARSQPNCDPQYVIDGYVDNMFGPSSPIRDIVGVEVYTGAADVPGEFAGSNSGCGVIVLWTRSGPTRR